MQQLAESAPSANTSSFAGLLAALATPVASKPADTWDDGLEDDVATFSYERALRSQDRHRASALADTPLTPAPEPALSNNGSWGVELPADHNPAPQSIRIDPASDPAHLNPARKGRNAKSASITIRLSEAECAQLRQRAAEAGLTISAYLRSCTFEAESLRAQVKEALAQMRSSQLAAAPPPPPAPPTPARSSWLRRILTR